MTSTSRLPTQLCFLQPQCSYRLLRFSRILQTRKGFFPTQSPLMSNPARFMTTDSIPSTFNSQLPPEPLTKDDTISLAADSAISSGGEANNFNKLDETLSDHENNIRLPRSVQAAYLRPLKRRPTHGLPVCDLQLRSYSVRNVEFMADFALRAAYYLKMPASGPVPLPKIVQRWTVPRANFIFKKSQENFERVTLRRLIQIKDAHPETVQIWLAYLRKHAFHGVGMKANIWQHEKLAVGEAMDADSAALKSAMEQTWALFGRIKGIDEAEKVVDAMHTDKIGTLAEGTKLKSFRKL